MMLLALLYHLNLYLFGFKRTRVRMSDGGISFVIPASLQVVNKLFTESFRIDEFSGRWIPTRLIEAYDPERRMKRVGGGKTDAAARENS